MNVASFLSAMSARVRAELAGREASLGDWLDSCLLRGREAWPDVALEGEPFALHLAAKVELLPALSEIEKLRAADLYLACACLHQNERAIAALERVAASEVDRVVARMRLSQSFAEDIHAWLREQLFFPPDRQPLVGDYSGRAPLASWIRSIAVHAALKVKKKGRIHVGDEVLGQVAAGGTPELEYIRRLHANEFRSALGRALAALTVRERNLLRQHYLDGLTLDAMAALYQVHRATLARWISAAREAVIDGIRRDLSERLSPSEIESLLRMVKGSLNLQISQVLRTAL